MPKSPSLLMVLPPMHQRRDEQNPEHISRSQDNLSCWQWRSTWHKRSMSSSVGTNSVSRSVLVPTNIALSSSIGMTPLMEDIQTADGVISQVARDNAGEPIAAGRQPSTLRTSQPMAMAAPSTHKADQQSMSPRKQIRIRQRSD